MKLVLVIAGAALLASTALADPAPQQPLPKPGDKRRVIAILDVRVGEGVPVEVAQQFQHDLDQMVDPQHYFLEPRSRVHDLMANSTKWTDGCVIGPCIREVKAQTQADVALIAALTGSGTSFGSVITLVRTDNGRVLDQQSARCDVCTLNEALATAEHASVKLLDALPPQLPDPDAGIHAAVAAATRPLEVRIATLQHHHHRTSAGVTLTIVGAVAAGLGLALYAAENHASYGLATAGAGAGLALGGVCVLAF